MLAFVCTVAVFAVIRIGVAIARLNLAAPITTLSDVDRYRVYTTIDCKIHISLYGLLLLWAIFLIARAS